MPHASLSTPPLLKRHELEAGQCNFLQAKLSSGSLVGRGRKRKFKQQLKEDKDRRINNTEEGCI